MALRSHPACQTSTRLQTCTRHTCADQHHASAAATTSFHPFPGHLDERESKPRREMKSDLFPKQGPRRKEKNKSPSNCRRSTYTIGDSPHPGTPSSLASSARFRPWIHDCLFSWLSFERFVFATGQHYEYVVAIAQLSQSLALLAKTLRTRLWHEARWSQITTQVFNRLGLFPSMPLLQTRHIPEFA